MASGPPVLVVTPGEPAGIGPEITLGLLAAEPSLRIVAVADPALLDAAAERTGVALRTRAWAPGEPVEPGVLHCRPVALKAPATPGHLDPRNARYVLETLAVAVDLVQAGHGDALVTGPVHKGVINDAGVPFTGHTEFLAEKAGVPRVVMMLAAPSLRVALVTTHLPLRAVPDAVTFEAVTETLRITARDLRRRFGIARPRLQVLGLNPHAGEGGHLGHEDDAVIRPAIEACRGDDVELVGPVPADTAFTPRRLAACDAVVAMYHDQGLPVLKHAGFGEAVNVTLGLPFVRTSVDHGTALDIAGTGGADPGSLVVAARLAARLATGGA